MAAPVKVARQQTTPELSGTFQTLPPEPTLSGTLRNLPRPSGTNLSEPSGTYLQNLRIHRNPPKSSGTFRNLSPQPCWNLPPEPTPAYAGTLRNLLEPSSGTCSCDPHRHTPELIWAEDPISLRCWGKKKLCASRCCSRRTRGKTDSSRSVVWLRTGGQSPRVGWAAAAARDVGLKEPQPVNQQQNRDFFCWKKTFRFFLCPNSVCQLRHIVLFDCLFKTAPAVKGYKWKWKHRSHHLPIPCTHQGQPNENNLKQSILRPIKSGTQFLEMSGAYWVETSECSHLP